VSDLVRGQLSDTAWRLAEELPVFGRFVSVGRDLDVIWRSGPREDAALRDDVIERAAVLVDQLRGEVTERFTDLSGELESQLTRLEEVVKRGTADPVVEQAFYLALLNEGIAGEQDLKAADFAVRYLSAPDLRILLSVYDRQGHWRWIKPSDFTGKSSDLPQLNVFEAGHRLARLMDFGFLLHDAAVTGEPGAARTFRPDLKVIDNFTEAIGLVRTVLVSPSMEYAGIAQAYDVGNLTALVTQGKRLWGKMHFKGGAVRRHLLDGYQWAVRADGSEPRYTGSFATAVEAQAAATEELRHRALSVNWVPIGA
jgi:hypothetical protein